MPKTFLGLLRQHRTFVISYLLFLVLGYVIQLAIPKTELFLLTNRHYNETLDYVFKVITMIGDGFTMVLIGLGMLFVRYRYSVVTVLAYAYSSVVVQIVKRLFNSPRPSKFFEGINPIRTLDGYPLYEWNSFPSGHSASAFTLAVVLTYLLPNKHKHWIILPMALLTAFSRVYLAQHFFQDIVAGSVLAVVLTFQLIWWLENSKWYYSPSLDGCLLGKNRLPKQRSDEPASETAPAQV
ncbi:phosphatase PAP2 family protein [Flavihumibacter sp. R14]|nr:phosphatase PAP2 family protein [Flavihumibacter soli]